MNIYIPQSMDDFAILVHQSYMDGIEMFKITSVGEYDAAEFDLVQVGSYRWPFWNVADLKVHTGALSNHSKMWRPSHEDEP